jgi:SHS family lactate transporter-like MFS transporter
MTLDVVGAEQDVSGVIDSAKFRDLSAVQWHAFFAAFLGWLLDGFDFSLLTFLLIDIQHSFTVDKALAGALGTVTLMFRLIGGLGAGTAADRFGRKRPLMFCIIWISLFSVLSGFSVTYGMLFACRALFGIGMGGVWAAGLPLALEHWPKKLRGIASGMLMGGFNWGYILAALVFQLLYPVVNRHSNLGWRSLFWVAGLPFFLVFWIRSQVKESPVWLAWREDAKRKEEAQKLSVVRIFQRDLIGTTLQTALIMSVFMFSYYSISFWYPTFLRESKLAPFGFLVALNLGGIAGSALWGRISETRVGRRGAISLAAFGGVLAVPIFLEAHDATVLMLGAFIVGLTGIGAWGMAPSYLTERFPTAARAVGPGFAYHCGAAVGSFTPTFIGLLQDHGVTLPKAMSVCMASAGLFLAIVIWVGPETRGRSFTADGA